MAKRQKMSSLQFDDLPDEVILKSLGFLDIKELLLCGQVSKRLRSIANDESLWLKLNFSGEKVPYDFIKKAAGNGCQYLCLAFCDILGLTGKSESSFNLKYLSLFGKSQEVTKLVQNCSSLQKLSLFNLPLDSDDIQYICQNGQTLQVLDIGNCNIDLGNTTELLQNLFSNCAHLTELNICGDERSLLGPPHIQALVDNLTPTILKVDLSYQKNLKNEHVKKLVKRCNKITHLKLRGTQITNDSVQSMIKHLNTSLEKLDVKHTDINTALFELKSMPTLKSLICSGCLVHSLVDIEVLKLKLTHIRINEEEFLHIATPFKRRVDRSIDLDWIWEIRVKTQDLLVISSDEFELRLSKLSRAELERLRAKLSQAEAFQFSS